MDDKTRDDLVARLSLAKDRKAALMVDLQAHAAKIEEVRATLGNPFFYSGRPEHDPHSESTFTGYKSHEPGLQLIRECHDASREIEAIQGRLRAVGLDSE